VFDIIRDNSPGNVPDIQALRVPVKRNLPTPLCFCFNSELDLIAKYALPEKIDILGVCPQVRVTEQLGEDSAWMMQVHLTVGKIIEEEHCKKKCRNNIQINVKSIETEVTLN